MKFTSETISFTCPSCGHTTKPHLAIKSLAEGRKLTCEKCGAEIPVDKEVFANVEKILDRLGVPDETGIRTTTTTQSSVVLRCPHCGTSSTVPMSLSELREKGKVFCQNCGKEIPIDREKIQKAQHALAGLKVPAADGSGTIDTPGGPVVVKTKTFSFNVNKNIEIGKPPTADADGPIIISAGSSGRPAIEPKKGCLGVMVVVVLFVAATLIYYFF